MFLRECPDYLCSTPQVLYTELWLQTLTFSICLPTDWTTGPMGGDERDMGELTPSY